MHGSFDHGLDFATMLRGGEGESHQALVPSRALFEIPDVDIFLGVFEGIGHKDLSNRPPWPENPRILASKLSKLGNL